MGGLRTVNRVSHTAALTCMTLLLLTVEAVWLEADQGLQTAGGKYIYNKCSRLRTMAGSIWRVAGHAWGPPDFLALAAKFGAVYLSGLKAFDVSTLSALNTRRSVGAVQCGCRSAVCCR